jgi:hypothetical protein
LNSHKGPRKYKETWVTPLGSEDELNQIRDNLPEKGRNRAFSFHPQIGPKLLKLNSKLDEETSNGIGILQDEATSN